MAGSSEQIKQTLIQQIVTGHYALGSRLPSCRDLARELGINRNTASKIYQELAEAGLVEIVRGRGVTVIKVQAATAATPPGMREHILAAAREAKLLRMERDEFLRRVLQVVDGLYQPHTPTVALVECNERDASTLAREIAAELALPVQPLLLSALPHPPELATGYDVICTTLYHLAAVKEAMGPAAARIIAVHAPPDPDALLGIARLDPQARIGIICERPTTQQYLNSAVGMVHPGGVRSCLLSDGRCLAELPGSIDVLVDVPSCHEQVQRLFPSIPIRTVGFRIDAKSLGPLRERVADLRSQAERATLGLE